MLARAGEAHGLFSQAPVESHLKNDSCKLVVHAGTLSGPGPNKTRFGTVLRSVVWSLQAASTGLREGCQSVSKGGQSAL